MEIVSISDIVKKPTILDNIDDIVKIVNKKTDEVKGIFISVKDLPLFENLIEEIEYQKWLERNRKGFEESQKELGDIFESAVSEIGKKL